MIHKHRDDLAVSARKVACGVSLSLLSRASARRGRLAALLCVFEPVDPSVVCVCVVCVRAVIRLCACLFVTKVEMR